MTNFKRCARSARSCLWLSCRCIYILDLGDHQKITLKGLKDIYNRQKEMEDQFLYREVEEIKEVMEISATR
jgi:hypothetical protein